MRFSLILVQLLFFSLTSQAQSDSMLANEAWRLVNASREKSSLLDSFYFKLDSIFVNVKYTSSSIITNNFFKNSSRSITIEYFFKRDSISYIETSEKAYMRPNLNYFSKYFLRGDSLIKIEHGSTRSNVQLGVVYTFDELLKIHSNPNRIDYSFLDKYVLDLLSIIKTKINN